VLSERVKPTLPGHPYLYLLFVAARQEGTGRVATAQIRLTVTAGGGPTGPTGPTTG
jgi:hypothetical protein